MSFTFESTEDFLRKLAPRPLSVLLRQNIMESIRLQEPPVFGDEHRRIEAKLAAAQLAPLHPQQFDVFSGAELDGRCEADWSSSLTPLALSEEYQDNVSAEMNGAVHVGGVSPVALRSDFFDKVVSEMDSVSADPEHAATKGPKVLAFPGQAVRSGIDSSSKSLLKIAAAVAVFGAAVGSFIPQVDFSASDESAASGIDASPSIVEVNPEPRVPTYSNLISPSLVPASYAADVRSPREHGLFVDQVNGPHYRVEFDEVEEMVLIDEQGRERTFERPRGKCQLLLPVDTQ